MFLFP